VRLPKKFNVHLDQKLPFVLACFQVSAPPRLENPDSDKKDALFGLDTQITNCVLHVQKRFCEYILAFESLGYRLGPQNLTRTRKRAVSGLVIQTAIMSIYVLCFFQ
jgi:hypothetical protein